MVKKTYTKCSLAPAVVFIFIFCTSYGLFASDIKIPERHPVEITKLPVCTECHPEDVHVASKPIAVFNHTGDYINAHKFNASQASALCNACHKVSFCTDCHAYKEELKPSEKYSGSPERWLPHRGDYIVQHRIDGRIDPARCFPCHGRQNNRVCKNCHK
jgi:hypothetical protein